jgi:hypothetical protein
MGIKGRCAQYDYDDKDVPIQSTHYADGVTTNYRGTQARNFNDL